MFFSNVLFKRKHFHAMSFACIFVPNFPVEALLRAAPEMRARAVAVLEGKPPLQKVVALNENARQIGGEPGMTKLQVEACAGLALRIRSAAHETSTHAALLACAQSFSPRVEDAGCDTVLIDLTGMSSLFGAPPQIAQRIAREVSALGIKAQVAVAANPDAAFLAARGFAGVTVIPQGKEAERLGDLPVEVLLESLEDRGWAEQLLETFHRWGIRNLEALAALPEIAFSERLGQEGIRLQKQARGAVSRTLVPVEPPLIFEETAELEYPLTLLEPLAFLLNQMLEKICAQLEEHALATRELRLRLELTDGHWDGVDHESNSEDGRGACPHTTLRPRTNSFQRTLRLPVPLRDARLFLKLLQLDLNAHPPGAPIVKIHLCAEPSRPRTAQSGLFLPPSPEPEKLELTLARIAGIVGEERAGSAALLDTHRPEGFRVRPFGREAEKPIGVEEGDSSEDLLNALRIFRPPAHVAVTVRDGNPARIACPQRKEMQGEVLWSSGPWRSSGDWWEREAWAREEWDIALQAEKGIAVYRLVRDLLAGKWLLEGVYD